MDLPVRDFPSNEIGDDEDARNDLVLEFVRVAAAVRAKVFLMENVTGLLGVRGRLVLNRFEELAQTPGYEVRTKVLNAADFGLPQMRKRVFVVGIRHDVSGAFAFPEPRVLRHQTVAEALAGLPPPAEERCTMAS